MIQEIILIYMPAMVANMAPIIAHRAGVLNWLDIPINVHLLGAHKTVRGFVVGIGAGAITAACMSFFIDTFVYADVATATLFGAATGFGALVGDSVKSYFKRRKNISSGTSWMPFDQIDFVIGATVFGLFFIHIPIIIFVSAIVIIGCASYIVSVVGVALHIKRSL